MKRQVLSVEKKRKIYGYVFTAPFILGTLLFFIYPIISSFILSCSKYKNITQLDNSEWVGIANYVEAFTIDINFMPRFLSVVRDTFINMPLVVVFSLILAVCLNKNIKGRGFFRIVFFFPFVLGTGLIFKYLLFSGASNETMEMVRGISLPGEVNVYLGSTVSAILTEFLNRITMVLWKSGLQILIFLSGIQSIPRSLYESARCDSATEWEMFWFITIPMLTPLILVNIVYTIIDSFNDINNKIMEYFIFVSFKILRFDYAAALSWIYFAFVFAVIMLVFIVMRKFIFYNAKRAGGTVL